MRIFDECWNRVPVSDDLVSEFVMFTYDVPLSKNFVPAHLAVFNERYLLMMKMHSEFTNLNGFEQEKLWKKNILYGSAMNLVKLECCKGGKEQWHFVYPTYLNETWKGKNILGQKNIKKIDMDIANSFSGKFTIALSFYRSQNVLGWSKLLGQEKANIWIYRLLMIQHLRFEFSYPLI